MSYVLLRVRQDKMSRVKNDAHQLLRVRQYKKSRVKNYAGMLLIVRQDKMRRVEKGLTQTCCLELNKITGVE